MVGFIKQILVTVVILIIGLAGLVWIKPDVGRTILASDIPYKETVRTLVVLISPEAGEAAPDQARGPGDGAFGGGGNTPAIVSAVRNETSATDLKALASAEAIRSVTVYPDNTSGVIEEVLVSSGDQVRAGQPLVRLESSSQAVAVDRATLMAEAAEDKLVRYEQLRQRNAATNVELSDIARERDAARLDLRDAQIALSKREITAPIDGRIGIVQVERGSLVESGTAIATIDARDRLKLVFYTPERYLSDMEVGTDLTAVSVARPDETYSGEIAAIDSRVAEDSRTVRTEGVILNRDDRLRPGMSFSLTIPLPGETYLATDPLAVVWERTGPFVWAVRDGKAQKAPVRIVQRDIDQVLIVSDALAVGDLVVVEGVQSMRNGLELDVEIRNDAPVASRDAGPAEVVSADISADVSTARAGEASGMARIGEGPRRSGVPLPEPANRSGS
ncbi:efflux RND transporter periplasmic adaptor subunit [Fulvimarina sp. 2208YS6-2-32]|uniref:Efflux RND transporter periplasmic adaptor subunit n=1 Tax=Fulvimarina uroteuthidis TaxID=3098149 RepID=A0ABU5HXR9_9HYPH|nr:efflux RND transporter periplasmic adaptor subunit [Fulvimarina sp. 2208YS6-2-32]MDY8107887.1 efflux RND transporter periplasmic adaptor subunit [Fulvimarina sp. 2208YS6-2-32]